MKKFLMAAALSLVFTAAPVFAATYEVVCAKCYVTKGAHGKDHAACGAKCVSGGGALALLKGDKLYVPVDGDFQSLRDQFKDKVGQMIALDGKVESKGGVNYLVVDTSNKK
ncbi:MAG TPA: hypothetical protein VFR02_00385 [bacterium]|nr:hypothetical protein [bacterium]